MNDWITMFPEQRKRLMRKIKRLDYYDLVKLQFLIDERIEELKG